MRSLFGRVILLGFVGLSGFAWSGDGVTDLDCWQISDEAGGEFRDGSNSFKGVYVGRLSIDPMLEEIRWALPVNSADGASGELLEKYGGQFQILEDKHAALLERTDWVSAVDISSKSFIVINRKTGVLLKTQLSWSRVRPEPFHWNIKGVEAECEIKEALF